MVYRQYLENVRGSINNYSLSELKSKEFMGIIQRVGQISDLSYIDVILQNAGVNISFIGDKKFLNEKVILKSKLDRYFESSTLVKDTAMKDALSEYMSMFIIEEDEIIESIEEIMGEDGIAEISLDYFPKSSARYYSAQEVLEKNKETLTALFGAVDEMNKKLNQEEESSSQFVEEYFDEESEDEELHLDGADIRDLIREEVEKDERETESKVENLKIDEDIEEEIVSEEPKTDGVEIEDEVQIEEEEEPVVSTPIKLSFGLEKDDEEIDFDIEDDKTVETSIEEPITSPIVSSQNKKMDVSFLLDDESETEEESSFEDKDEDSFDEYDTEVSRKDFRAFLEQDEEEPVVEGEEETARFDTNFDYEEDEDDYEGFIDNTGRVLSKELEDDDDRLLRDTDPIERNLFEETANYFLTGKSEVYGKDDLRSLYKSKEKIVDSEDVSSTDDAVAKMVLAMTDGLLNLPRVTGRLFKKAKNSGRKMRENMIVEDEDDDG